MNAENTRFKQGMQPGPQASMPGEAERDPAQPDGLFETIAHTGHEEVIFCNNPAVGLKAIIAIHKLVIAR